MGHEAAIERKHLRLRQVGGRTVFVRVAEDELTWLERRARAWSRIVAAPFDRWLRQPIAKAEVIVGMIKWRCRVQVQRRKHFDALPPSDKFFVLRLRSCF